MRTFIESTWPELYQSAVDAFPDTTRRQHVTDPIAISDLMIVPFVGMKTLFIRSTAVNEDREYRPMILVKGIAYHDDREPGDIQIRASDGGYYWMEQPMMDDNEVLLRCNCQDFYWRFNYYDHLDRSLYGRKRTPYEATINPGSANPQQMPGACKHLMKMMEVLNTSGIIVG